MASKNKLKEESKLTIDEAERLYEYFKKDLERIKGMLVRRE